MTRRTTVGPAAFGLKELSNFTMNQPDISIITPTLNYGRFILDTLRSVHLHNQACVEHIIIDGGSTDDTAKIVSDFRKKYSANIIFVEDKDSNMYGAINIGLSMMKGNVWACLNSDDCYAEGAIDYVKDRFKSDPHLRALVGSLVMIDENSEYLCTRYTITPNKKRLLTMKKATIFPQPASFFHRDVFDRVGCFNTDFTYAADYDYFIRVCDNFTVAKTGTILTKFRRHRSSLSSHHKPVTESSTIAPLYLKNSSSVYVMRYVYWTLFWMVNFRQVNFAEIKKKIRRLFL